MRAALGRGLPPSAGGTSGARAQEQRAYSAEPLQPTSSALPNPLTGELLQPTGSALRKPLTGEWRGCTTPLSSTHGSCGAPPIGCSCPAHPHARNAALLPPTLHHACVKGASFTHAAQALRRTTHPPCPPPHMRPRCAHSPRVHYREHTRPDLPCRAQRRAAAGSPCPCRAPYPCPCPCPCPGPCPGPCCACVQTRACSRVCVRACMRACVHACLGGVCART